MKTIWSLMRVSVMVIAASPAFAQVTNISPELASGQPVLQTPEIELQVGPRFWYLWATSAIPTPTNPASVSTSSTASFPMAGGTLSARFRALPDTTFVLSTIYGTSNTSDEALLVNPNPPFPSVTSNKTTQDLKRLDVELLALTSISDTPWAWIWGGRFEHNSADTTIRQTSAFVNPLIVQSPVSIKGQTTSNFYTIKGGMSGAVPISESGNLRLFGNVMALAGVNSVSSAGAIPGVVGTDFSMGLQYVFSPTIVADVRYRGLVQFLVGAPKNFQDFVVQQGPMVGITYKF